MTLDARTVEERTSLAGVGEDATLGHAYAELADSHFVGVEYERCSPAETLPAEFARACQDLSHPYHTLAKALLGAYAQAAHGKGRERHANALPFQRQRMQTIAQGMGSTHGMTYQVCKKAQECERMDPDAKIRELQGAIVYAAGAIVFEELRDDR